MPSALYPRARHPIASSHGLLVPEAVQASREGRPGGAARMDENAVAASKKNASRRNGAIFFEDEVGFSQQGTTIRTWAPRGEGAIIDSAPGRSSVKAFGAVEYADAPRTVYTFAKKLNGGTFIEFLQALLKH